MDLEKRIAAIETRMDQLESRKKEASRVPLFRNINFYLIAGLVAVAAVSAMSELGKQLENEAAATAKQP